MTHNGKIYQHVLRYVIKLYCKRKKYPSLLLRKSNISFPLKHRKQETFPTKQVLPSHQKVQIGLLTQMNEVVTWLIKSKCQSRIFSNPQQRLAASLPMNTIPYQCPPPVYKTTEKLFILQRYNGTFVCNICYALLCIDMSK